jgi:hypothetical protein
VQKFIGCFDLGALLCFLSGKKIYAKPESAYFLNFATVWDWKWIYTRNFAGDQTVLEIDLMGS